MLWVWSNSANTKVLLEDVAWFTKSAAARGDVADFDRSTKGSKALRAFCWIESMVRSVQIEIGSSGCRQNEIGEFRCVTYYR